MGFISRQLESKRIVGMEQNKTSHENDGADTESWVPRDPLNYPVCMCRCLKYSMIKTFKMLK